MKLIFLDIDGVMNHRTHFVRSRQHHGQEFSPLAVRNLREIIKTTGSKMVLSSTWRKHSSVDKLKGLFSWYDLSRYLIDKTPYIEDAIRGLEIQRWISENPLLTIESFVILDDDNDMGELLPYLVQTDHIHGLTDDKREEAIKSEW